jgi:hypothetical protein
MPVAQAAIPTSRAAAYLTRLCGHAGKMSTTAGRLHHRPRAHAGGPVPQVRQVKQHADGATITFDCGQLALGAAPGQLHVRVEAADPGSLRRIQDLLTTRLRTLARREQLVITWHPVPASGEPSAGA